MIPSVTLGQLLHSYFLDHLITIKGLRPGSVRSDRDTIRLLLVFIAADKRCKLTRLQLADLTFERILAFLRHVEHDRGNSISTRNQRLAAIPSLFEYIATRSPEMLAAASRSPRSRPNASRHQRPASWNATKHSGSSQVFRTGGGSRCATAR